MERKKKRKEEGTGEKKKKVKEGRKKRDGRDNFKVDNVGLHGIS